MEMDREEDIDNPDQNYINTSFAIKKEYDEENTIHNNYITENYGIDIKDELMENMNIKCEYYLKEYLDNDKPKNGEKIHIGIKKEMEYDNEEDFTEEQLIEYRSENVDEVDPLAIVKDEPLPDTETTQDGSTSQADLINKVKIGNEEDPLSNSETPRDEVKIGIEEHNLNKLKEEPMINKTDLHKGTSTCTLCKKTFINKSSLVRHMLSHSGERPYECPICKKSYRGKFNRDEHIREHTGEKPHECKLCNEKFSRIRKLHIHMREHSSESLFECKICYKKLSGKQSLAEHMRVVHVGDKPYACDKCEKTFSCKGNRAVHLRVHSKEKPYECEVCNKNYTTKAILEAHMRIHTGETPYECEICRKKFTYKCNRVVHMRVHTGEKPYECEICRYKFSKISHLTKHLKTHTHARKQTLDAQEKNQIYVVENNMDVE